MPPIKILTKNDIQTFDSPPVFNNEDRRDVFYPSNWLKAAISKCRSRTNEAGLMLQAGYFIATHRFFTPKKFHDEDISFVASELEVSRHRIKISAYTETTFKRHQKIILENVGFYKFDDSAKSLLKEEAANLCTRQAKPRAMFNSIIELLDTKKIETPCYFTLSEIITESIATSERKLVALLKKSITPDQEEFINTLLDFQDAYKEGDKKDSKIKNYKLTLLKKSNQSIKLSSIRENIRDLATLEMLFRKINPIISKLNLSEMQIQYYAQSAIKSQIFQVSRSSNRTLLLISFVAYQYFRLNDILIEILMKSVKTKFNSIERDHKKEFYEQRAVRNEKLSIFTGNVADQQVAINDAKAIVFDLALSEHEKIALLISLFSGDFETNAALIEAHMHQIDNDTKKIARKGDYYEDIAKGSLSLQKKVSDIVKKLEFDCDNSDEKLTLAIEYYKQKNGALTSNAPVDFLTAEEQELILDSDGKLRISLYKMLFFQKIANGISSGALNLKNSYRYKAFDEYLIPAEVWNADTEKLLTDAKLLDMKDCSKVLSKLSETMDSAFKTTNENIMTGKNEYVKFNKTGKLRIHTPKKWEEREEPAASLFPRDHFISLFEVLSTVNNACNFTDSFEHWNLKRNREKPSDKVFFAGTIGYGCNLGIQKTVNISKDINGQQLENTINWYFSKDNITSANNSILGFMDKLQLLRIFKRNQNITHTSSDGQKFPIAVESLNSNYSYKYFGKGEGVSVYSLIDESHRLLHSTVINPAEREAAYVIDSLMHNEVVQSNIHSTDTHGYSEIVFGATHLLGVSFAPRIKRFWNQQLYCFDSPSAYRDLGYSVLPKKRINTKIIAEQWDSILRLIATIKLKKTTASQLFKRLSSYSRQHPLYRALKELGRIIKTIFLLKYVDDVELRQMIEKQLNKLESSNKFGKAVFHGNNREFQQVTKEEQLVADGCKRLIENAIICWNYLYLSQKIFACESDEERENLVETIKQGSVIVWQHINLHGVYDFSEEVLKNSVAFNLPELLELEVPLQMGRVN